ERDLHQEYLKTNFSGIKKKVIEILEYNKQIFLGEGDYRVYQNITRAIEKINKLEVIPYSEGIETKLSKEIVVFGINGASLVECGLRFSQAFYNISFVDDNEKWVELLRHNRTYKICKFIMPNLYVEEFIKDVNAFSLLNKKDSDDIIKKIINSDLVFVAMDTNYERIGWFIAKAIEERVNKKLGVLTVIVCSNQRGQDIRLLDEIKRNILLEYHDRLSKKLNIVEAILDKIAFIPEGQHDKLTVMSENFEHDLVINSTKYRKAIMNKLKNVGGISFLSNFDFIRYLKLYTFSLHAICAYMGYLKGYKHINEAVNDKEILELLVSAKRQLLWVFERKFPQFMDEECKDYLDKVIDRFKELPDLIIRVSRHVEMKLGYDERLIGPARWIWEENGDVGPFIIGIAMALNYGMFKERGKDIDKDVLDDKQAKELQNYLETQGIDFVLKRICGVGLKENDPLDIKLFYLIKDKFLSLRLQTNCLVKAISEVSNRSLEEVSKYFDKLDKLFKEGKLYIDFKEAIEVMEEKGIPFDGIFVKRERIENGEVYWHTIISNKDAEDKKEEDYNPLSQVIDKLDNIKHWVGAKDDIQPLSKIQKVKDSIVEENKALNNLLQGIKEKMGFSEKAIKDLGSELIIPEDFIDKMLSSMPTRHIEAESVSLERLRIQVIGGYFMVKSFLKEGSLKRPYISITNPIGVHYTEVVFVFEGRDNISTDLEDIEKIINKLGGNIIQKWGIDYKISSEKIAVLFFEIQKINEKRGFTQKEIREKHLSCVNIYPVEIQNFYQDWTKKIDICKSVVSKEKVILSDIGELLIAVNGRGLISTYPYYEREKRLDLYRKTFVPKKPKSLLEGLKDCNERILEILNKKKTEGSIMISVFGPEASGKDYFSL
ncbi:MAG: hypothetical protein NC822_07540, partial [Candidatus Omnitrophica bacterium]|nr:hypothetical protein [Candidatus Omnitrophota bacterium]